jgi:hypothetical protein
LLRLTSPELKEAHFVLVLVGVPGAKQSHGLSSGLRMKLREIVAQVLGLVTEEVFE